MTKHHNILGVVPKCGAEFLKARWRTLAKQHHPDSNPDANVVVFTEIRKAYQAAMKYETDYEARCKNCDGTGKIEAGKGFNRHEMRCPKCEGRGR
jgi:DnaJ-class molecular chaperone